MCGRQICFARLLIQQKDPACAQVEQLGNLCERGAHRARQIDLTVQRFRDCIENRKFAIAPL